MGVDQLVFVLNIFFVLLFLGLILFLYKTLTCIADLHLNLILSASYKIKCRFYFVLRNRNCQPNKAKTELQPEYDI